MSNELPPAVRRYFSEIGSRKTARKSASSSANIRKAQAAKSAPVERLETAYKAVRSGKLTMTAAAIDPGKCSYYTLKRYAARRDAGETTAEIKGAK